MIITRRNILYSILFLLISFPVFVDLINGYFISLGYTSPIGIIYRGLFSCILFIITLKYGEKKINLFVYLLVGFWIVLNFYWVFFNRDFPNIFFEISELVKLLYVYLILSFIIYFIREKGVLHENLRLFIIIFSSVASISIIISFFTGFGIQTYGEYTFAVKSYFKAQNDIGLAILLSLPFLCYRCFSSFRLLDFFLMFLNLIGLILLGTRAGIIGGLITIAIFLFYSLFTIQKKISITSIKRFFIKLLFFSSIVYGCFQIYSLYTKYSYMINKYEKILSESPRSLVEDIAENHFSNRGAGKNMFGEGAFVFRKNIEKGYRGNKKTGSFGKPVEQDLYDLFGAYGFIFTLLMFIFPVLLLFKQCVNCFIELNLLDIAYFLAIILFLTHSILAGHALGSPTVSTQIAITFAYIYNRKLKIRV